MPMDMGQLARRLQPPQLLVDLAIAGAVLVLSLLPLFEARDCRCDPAPAWGFGLVVAQAVPLVWRRRYPFSMSLLSGLLAMAYGLTELPDSPVPYAGLVALYSVAAHGTRQQARVAGVIAAVGIAAIMILDWPESDYADITINYLLFATAWLLGDSARHRRDRAQEMEARAEQLERTRAAEAAGAVVAERNRIAREMHDIIAHHVSLMVVQAEAGPVVLTSDPPAAVAAFDSISATGKQALTEMRRLLGVLRDVEPPTAEVLAPQPGTAALPELVDRVRATGLEVDLVIDGGARALPPAVDLSAYRVLQEALTNTVRHAGAERAVVRLRYAEDALSLEVLDDGSGQSSGSGHGLLAMQERVALVGGSVTAGPRSEGGWGVRARLPLDGAPR